MLHLAQTGHTQLPAGALDIEALDAIRNFRNRLMHFKDPLSPEETSKLTNFCDLVREIPL